MSRRLRNPELAAIEVEGVTRSAFILRGALAAGAMYGTGAVGSFVSQAFAQTPASDLQVIGFAYGLETIEAAFYAAALKRAKLPGALRKLATEFGQHENTHVATLKNALSEFGAPTPAAPKVKFNVSSSQAFLKLAVQLEDLGVGAYNGAAPLLKTPELVQTAGTIVQVEARHAAALRVRAGQPPAPAAFDKALSQSQVNAAVKQATG
jgi:rubrerythrin